jgi:hypothetical protein
MRDNDFGNTDDRHNEEEGEEEEEEEFDEREAIESWGYSSQLIERGVGHFLPDPHRRVDGLDSDDDIRITIVVPTGTYRGRGVGLAVRGHNKGDTLVPAGKVPCIERAPRIIAGAVVAPPRGKRGGGGLRRPGDRFGLFLRPGHPPRLR